MKRFLVSIMFLLLATPAHAALSLVNATMGTDDVREVNNATPGTSKTFLGTRIKGPTTTGSTTYASGDNGNPAFSCVTGASDFTTPTTTVFYKTTGTATGESYCLGDGTYNQRLTIVLVTDGGRDFTVTPLTKTGLSNVALNDSRDSVTLNWSGTEWYVEGNNGATVN